jgi:hypothetical protein
MDAMNQFDIQPGWEVCSRDGDKIGSVREIQGQYFVLTKGMLLPKDYYIPFSGVNEVDAAAHRVFLNTGKDELDNRGWDRQPTDFGSDAHAQGDYAYQRSGAVDRSGDLVGAGADRMSRTRLDDDTHNRDYASRDAGHREHGTEAVGGAAGALGGAIVGGAVAGPPGAIVGGIVGAAGGAAGGEAMEGRDKAGSATGGAAGAVGGALLGGAVAGPPGAIVGGAVGAGAGAGAGDKAEEEVEGRDDDRPDRGY